MALAHAVGSAEEIIADPSQLVPVTAALRAYELSVRRLPAALRAIPARIAGELGLFDNYLQAIRRWRAGARPAVCADPRFLPAEVIRQWQGLLSVP